VMREDAMEDKSPHRIRLREVVEGALGEIIGALVLAALGVVSGVTIGWIPTLIVLGLVAAVVFTWYKADPSLQRLVRRRIAAIRLAVSSEADVLPRWNIIAENALSEVARENNIILKEYLSISHRRLVRRDNQEYLQMVLEWLGGFKWYLLLDSTGNIVDQYGGWPAIIDECPRCHSPVLRRFSKDDKGKITYIEPDIRCRWCKQRIVLEDEVVVPPRALPETIVVLKEVKEPVVKVTSNSVTVRIEFVIENKGRAGRVCPYIEFKVVDMQKGIGLGEQIIRSPASWVVEVDELSTYVIACEWIFAPTIIPLVKPPHKVKVELYPYPEVQQ